MRRPYGGRAVDATQPNSSAARSSADCERREHPSGAPAASAVGAFASCCFTTQSRRWQGMTERISYRGCSLDVTLHDGCWHVHTSAFLPLASDRLAMVSLPSKGEAIAEAMARVDRELDQL
jgi:hypothetical protein